MTTWCQVLGSKPTLLIHWSTQIDLLFAEFDIDSSGTVTFEEVRLC